jgi:hypothetical protein
MATENTESTDKDCCMRPRISAVGWAERAKPNAVDPSGITSFSPTYRLDNAVRVEYASTL